MNYQLFSNDRLTPTGRNEVFGLSHTVLRLLLYVIQKIDMDSIDVNLMFTEIRSCLKQLLFNDSPMDTKSVCGILLVSMHIVENGDNSWVDVSLCILFFLPKHLYNQYNVVSYSNSDV